MPERERAAELIAEKAKALEAVAEQNDLSFLSFLLRMVVLEADTTALGPVRFAATMVLPSRRRDE